MAELGECVLRIGSFLISTTVTLFCSVFALFDLCSIYRTIPFIKDASRDCSLANFWKASMLNFFIFLIDIPTIFARLLKVMVYLIPFVVEPV